MNRARVATLLREIATLHSELADAIEAEDLTDESGPLPVAEPRRRREKRARRAPELVRPAGDADPAVKSLAARLLRNRGFRA